jgi:glycosyltransferase involved in cell wall biosynthesis
MLRVMMLITDLQPGGSPLRIARLARKLREFDVEPIVGCLAPAGPLSDQLRQGGIETFACNARGARDLFALRRLGYLIDEYQPDLIHATLFHANLAARMCNRRCLPLITSTVTIEIERRWHNWLEGLTLDMSDCHVANSRAVANHLLGTLGVGPRKLRIIPNGLDLQAIDSRPPIERGMHGLSNDIPLIVWAGRLDTVKNLPTFIDVVERVRCKREVAAVILGEGGEREEIQRRIALRGLENTIRLAGWTEDVIGWLKTADLLLFPSLTEGSSNVLLEAMACRCPIVASDIDSCRESLGHGRSRLCSPHGVTQFANAVLASLEDSANLDDQVSTARRYVERLHDLTAIGGKWKRLYCDIIGHK